MSHIGHVSVFALVDKVIVNGGMLASTYFACWNDIAFRIHVSLHFDVDEEDDRFWEFVAFLDVELAAAAVHTAAFAVVGMGGLVVVDATALHVDDTISDVDAATVVLGRSVVGHHVAVDGDVALLVVDTATIQVGGVVADDGVLRGVEEAVAGSAGSCGDVATVGEDAAAMAFHGAVAAHVAAIEQDVARVVVHSAAVDVGLVSNDVGIMGVDGAVFQVDAAAASGGVGGSAVLATGLVLHHVGAKQADGVAKALVGVGMGAFAEDGTAVAQGCRIVVNGGMTNIDASCVVIEGTAIQFGDVVEHLGAVVEGCVLQFG